MKARQKPGLETHGKGPIMRKSFWVVRNPDAKHSESASSNWSILPGTKARDGDFTKGFQHAWKAMNATAFHIGQQKQLNTVLVRLPIKWLVIRWLKHPQASLHETVAITEMSNIRSSRRASNLSTGLFKVVRGVNKATHNRKS